MPYFSFYRLKINTFKKKKKKKRGNKLENWTRLRNILSTKA